MGDEVAVIFICGTRQHSDGVSKLSALFGKLGKRITTSEKRDFKNTFLYTFCLPLERQ